MVTQANNIVGIKNVTGGNAANAATIQSLARIESPPDTLPVTTALQTTLNLQEMLGLFRKELEEFVRFEGLTYRMNEYGVLVQHGNNGRHRASYGLTLHTEELGEISLSSNRQFSEQDLALSEYLLCALLYPLRNALRYHAALENAYVDPLTGIHNRAAMQEALPREIELARRHGLSLTMALIDLDHFKKINDQHGHAIGDCALRHAAEQASRVLRTSDRIFRYGGEEFIVLFHTADDQGVMKACERIRAAISEQPFLCDSNELSVSASIGYAKMNKDDTQHTLFDKADKALYKAKEQGRNRVAAWQNDEKH
jgi:diguanylate cyclase (GGDEF)-like protein